MYGQTDNRPCNSRTMNSFSLCATAKAQLITWVKCFQNPLAYTDSTCLFARLTVDQQIIGVNTLLNRQTIGSYNITCLTGERACHRSSEDLYTVSVDWCSHVERFLSCELRTSWNHEFQIFHIFKYLILECISRPCL